MGMISFMSPLHRTFAVKCARAGVLSLAGCLLAAALVQSCAGPASISDSGASTYRSLSPGLSLDAARGDVRVDGIVSLNEGWLEQVACLRGTRDHEVLVTTTVQPSAIHGALLLAGATSGRPGSWSWTDGALSQLPPSGTAVDVFVQTGDAHEIPIATWIRGEGGRVFPDKPWRFAGSNFVVVSDGIRDTNGQMTRSTQREQYEADMSGSLIGIVTFGDEVLGWPEVLPHQLDVQDVLWEAAGDRMPPVGTAVTLILRTRLDR